MCQPPWLDSSFYQPVQVALCCSSFALFLVHCHRYDDSSYVNRIIVYVSWGLRVLDNFMISFAA